jgi:hypothetical protein
MKKSKFTETQIVEQYFGSEKASETINKNDRRVELKVLHFLE